MKTTVNAKTMVRQMREIRDQISKDIMNMTLDEEQKYLTEQLEKLKSKRSKQSV